MNILCTVKLLSTDGISGVNNIIFGFLNTTKKYMIFIGLSPSFHKSERGKSLKVLCLKYTIVAIVCCLPCPRASVGMTTVHNCCYCFLSLPCPRAGFGMTKVHNCCYCLLFTLSQGRCWYDNSTPLLLLFVVYLVPGQVLV